MWYVKSVNELLRAVARWKSFTSLAFDNGWRKESNLKAVLDGLDQGSIQLDSFTYVPYIRECGALGVLSDAIRLHDHILQSGVEQDVYMRESLVHMYLKCASLQHAEDLFQKLHSRDVTAWTAMLGAYSRHSNVDNKQVFRCYNQMLQEGVRPDMFTFTTMLKTAVLRRALKQGRAIHSQVAEAGCDADEIIGTSIISMYGKCDSVQDARAWFDKIARRQQHGVVTWNAMISAYEQNGWYVHSFQLFRLMLLEGVAPNNVTLVTMLNACNSLSALEVGKLINACIKDLGLETDVILGTALLNMYGKCQSMKEVEELFARIQTPDIVSWNSLISAHVHDQAGRKPQALVLFKRFLQEGLTPNNITFMAALNACARPEDLLYGRTIHSCIAESGFESVLFIGNALVDMYGKCHSLENAWSIFQQMKERNVVTWSVMVAAYVENGQAQEAVQLFRRMISNGDAVDPIIFINVLNACAANQNLAQGKAVHRNLAEVGFESDLVLATSLLNMFIKCGSLEDARLVFNRLDRKNVVTWNTMMSGYAQNDCPRHALQLFQQMEPELADQTTYVIALDACAILAAVTEGREVHHRITERKITCDVVLGTALVNMYGKSGCLEEARGFFDSMVGADTVTFNTMLGSYAQHGHSGQVFHLFRKMKQEGIKPDSVSFVIVLWACSHVGNLEKGSEFFTSMVVDYEMKPSAEHFGCLLDLLSRVGMLEEAEELMNKLPTKAGNVEWITLLAACKTQSDVLRAQTASKRLLTVDPKSSTAYVVLASIG